MNSDKAARPAEFKPQWTAPQGAQELYEAYQKVGLQLEEFEGPRYRRIDHVRHLLERGVLAAGPAANKSVPAMA